jgi:glycosyltransferase involved in cell wall biosynthesis
MAFDDKLLPGLHGSTRPVAEAVTIQPPLVSVIIVNYNYGRFLEAAVTSVLVQTYPRVECIVVDNASDDESDTILKVIEERGLAVQIIRRAANHGQTTASLEGLEASHGAYVIFVDADDLLLPTCVEAHVHAHLSLRVHVGFTSGDMLQVGGDETDPQVIVATGEAFNNYIRSGKGLKRELVRPYQAAPGEWPAPALAARLDGRIHHVPPLHTSWVWSPTSGNCYRRDALEMFADLPTLADLRTGTDMYFGHGIGALCGSALIDEPVFAYRIHGANIYTQRAQLDRTLCFRPGGGGDSNDHARLLIIDQLVARAARFAPNIWLKLNLVALLTLLDKGDRDPHLMRWQRRSRLASRIAEASSFADTMGTWLTRFLKLWSGVPLRFW